MTDAVEVIMSIVVKDLLECIDSFAPFNTAEDWDNVGILVGSPSKTVHKILMALDITETVINEAVDMQIDLIISHHPLIFSGVKHINDTDRLGASLMKLIQNDIAVIAAHTNIDCSFEYGINRQIGNLYALQDTAPLSIEHSFGIVGRLPHELTLDQFIMKTKEVFNIQLVKIVNQPSNDDKICKIGICSGSSADFIVDAIHQQVDAFITSDIKYHEGQTVVNTGVMLADVGHYESEFLYLNYFKEIIMKHIKTDETQLEIYTTKTEKPLFYYL